MELRHLRYFIAVARELHFTRAAERLRIRQPPLSLQIRQLEKEMGTALFRRLTRGVELTAAGALLAGEAQQILALVEQTKIDVQRRARGETGHIHLGFAGATYLNRRIVPGVMRDFRERFPAVVMSPEQSNTPRLVAGLRSGEIDVAFVRPPVNDPEGLVIEPLVEECMTIVLPETHPRAGDAAMPLAELARETLILFPRAIGPGLYDSIIAGCRQAGFIPELGQEASQIPSSVYMVAAGFGVTIVPHSVAQIQAEGVAYLAIEGDAPLAPISLAYRRNEQSPAVRNFVNSARQSVRLAPALA